MAGFSISVNTTGARNALTKFTRDFSEKSYLKLVHLRFLSWVDENFRKHGSDRKWKPLSPNTIAGRRKQGRGGVQPLRDTGRMAQSFTAGSRIEFAQGQVRIGTPDPKAEWHHFGTAPHTINPRNRKVLRFVVAGAGGAEFVFRKQVHHPGLPARPLLPTESTARRILGEVLDGYVKALIRKAKSV